MTLLAGYEYPDGKSVDFYGVEVLGFYLKRLLLYFSDYTINIRLLYGLIIACCMTMMVVFALFIIRIKHNRRDEREYVSAYKNLHEGFYSILISDHKPTVEDLELACGLKYDAIVSYRPVILSRLISEICMDLSRELGNIPNTEPLCALTGVKGLYESNLATSRKVLTTLQNLANMHIPVNEGLLAIYINHYKRTIRHMARICHIISSTTDPYQYILEDLDEPQGLWRYMMLHRIFGWLWANDRQMPQFLVLSEKLNNDDSVAFLIEEVAYWGSEREKKSLHELFLSPNYRYRTAALQAMAILRDKDQERDAVNSYDQQPDSIRQEVLKAVASVNSGQYTDFFVKAYRTSPSKQTREVALTCLYTYGNDGRRAFEMLRGEVLESDTDRVLMDQIDAIGILNQMRRL